MITSALVPFNFPFKDSHREAKCSSEVGVEFTKCMIFPFPSRSILIEFLRKISFPNGIIISTSFLLYFEKSGQLISLNTFPDWEHDESTENSVLNPGDF